LTSRNILRTLVPARRRKRAGKRPSALSAIVIELIEAERV
jgi:hypothetical protein